MKRSFNGIEETFLSKSSEERAFAIMSRYFHMQDEVSDHQKESFAKWLTSPGSMEAKGLAMERIFTDIMETEEAKT